MKMMMTILICKSMKMTWKTKKMTMTTKLMMNSKESKKCLRFKRRTLHMTQRKKMIYQSVTHHTKISRMKMRNLKLMMNNRKALINSSNLNQVTEAAVIIISIYQVKQSL